MTLALIVNPSAGGGRAGRALPAVQQTLNGLGLEHRTEPTRSLEHARELARRAAAAGETAVAFGGDGLVAAVGGAISEPGGVPGVLGVLPGGRGNDFARTLGIPLEATSACQVLSTGAERRIDLGDVDGNPFIGIASCGFDSVANRIANETRIVRGNLVYAYGLLRALISWEPATFTIEIDGGPPRTLTGYTIAAANSRAYGGGMMLAPAALLDDGCLDVVTIADVPRLRFLRHAPTVFNGTHIDQPNIEVIRCASITISASRPFEMYADGDPIAELPVTIGIRPGAMRVIAPL